MKPGIALSYTLKGIMVLLFFIGLWKQDWGAAFGCLVGLVIVMIPTFVKRRYDIALPWVLELMITLALFIHVSGGVLGLYDAFVRYDTLAHFVSSCLIALLAFTFIYILHVYWDGLHMDKYAMAFVVVITTMAMGVVWEVYEWVVDMLFGTTLQLGLWDTMKDLVMDTVGGIIIAIIGVQWIKTGKMDEMTKDLGKAVDEKIIRREKKEKKK